MIIIALVLVVLQALLLLRVVFGGPFVAMRADQLAGRRRCDPEVEPEQEACDWAADDWLATTTMLAFDPTQFEHLRRR